MTRTATQKYPDARIANLKNTLEGKQEWQRAAWVWGNRHGDWLKNKHLPVPKILPPAKWNEKLNGMLPHYLESVKSR